MHMMLSLPLYATGGTSSPAGDADCIHIENATIQAEEVQKQHAQAALTTAPSLPGGVQQKEGSHHHQQPIGANAPSVHLTGTDMNVTALTLCEHSRPQMQGCIIPAMPSPLDLDTAGHLVQKHTMRLSHGRQLTPQDAHAITCMLCVCALRVRVSVRVHMQADRRRRNMAHLIELALLQEDLEHQHQRPHGGELQHQLAHNFGCHWAVGDIKADVKVEFTDGLLKLDDGHLCLTNHLHRSDAVRGDAQCG